MTADDILVSINGYLDRLRYDRKPASLYEPIKYVLSIGGKRIRPTLMMLAYNLFREHPEEILPVACAIETYHNYTLLHDDLMDNADLRRGMPTVHRKWDANTAILSGDTMLVLAYKRLASCSDKFLRPLLDLFTETALEIGEGQQYDMDFENRTDVTEDEYIEMIRLKTSVLLACSLKMGAILAEAPAVDAQSLYDFGVRVGLAFQLQDDWLDVYGDPKVFGKQTGGDIVSNKKTYMLIQAFNHADEKTRNELTHWLEARDFDRNEKVAAVTAIYDRLGIGDMAIARINAYFEDALRYLADVDVEDERKEELRDYTMKMMKREK